MKNALMHAAAKFTGLVASLALGLAATPKALAQCEPQWQPFDSVSGTYPGVNGMVTDTTVWDPDGPGPMTPRLVVCGGFTIAGDKLAHTLAVVDPDSGAWSTLDPVLNNGKPGFVSASTVLASGKLVAGGSFTQAGAFAASNIAQWDGLAWSPLGTGLNAHVGVLAALPTGGLVAGGNFTEAGGVPASKIAQWNGSAWSALGSGIVTGNTYVRALAALPNGDVVVGGYFYSVGGVSTNNIARWDGESWSALGAGVDSAVNAIAALPSGELVVGGQFNLAGGKVAKCLAQWKDLGGGNGTWTPFGTPIIPNGYPDTPGVFALDVLENGDVIVGGSYIVKIGAQFKANIARWDADAGGPGAWTEMGSGTIGYHKTVHTITTLPLGDTIAGGEFAGAGGTAAPNLARWSEASKTWSALGTGIGGLGGSEVRAIAELPKGELVIGGTFSTVGGIETFNVARWDGSSWSAMGNGLGAGNSTVIAALAADGLGRLVAGGYFPGCIAEWNGASWATLGPGIFGDNPWVLAITVHPSGDVIATGRFVQAGTESAMHVARWDGSTWMSMGSGLGGPTSILVRGLAVATLPSGDVVVGGTFTAAGGVNANCVAQWDGLAWSPLGPGLTGINSTVYALAVLPSGDLIVGGGFSAAGGMPANSIARWNIASQTWSPMGSGLYGGAYALALRPNGDLIAGGSFTMAGGIPVQSVARWDGAFWSSMEPSFGGGQYPWVNALATLNSGDLAASGLFTTAGNSVAPYLARYACPTPPPCPADCDASGGLNIDDFICFQTLFVLGDPAADCDANAQLNFDDFICFQTLFAIGC
jgi:trimeric autotransporter adhesin